MATVRNRWSPQTGLWGNAGSLGAHQLCLQPLCACQIRCRVTSTGLKKPFYVCTIVGAMLLPPSSFL